VKIQLVTPAPLRFNNGNKITALRWARILRTLGHRVKVLQHYDEEPCDALIALHARRSYHSIRSFHKLHPERPLIVVLTGTDLYHDLHRHRSAQRSLELATRIVALQKMALSELSETLHPKTQIIYQSAERCLSSNLQKRRDGFRASVVGHLRKEKDPLRTAFAIRRLPKQSQIKVQHIGRALDKDLERRARAEMVRNPRYRWVGELPHKKTRQILAQSDVTVITSRIEGSSNVLSEALACAVPVIASRIPGLMGTLGKDYPGYFAPGDTVALREILMRAETDRKFYRSLKSICRRLSPLVAPKRELAAWQELLEELF
ncbi:MAG TPA: selenoneine biosynthesis selenosugar synthase SenB, partial [Candidatus Polarisedimenticolaceae bacterium]|nr:selenoneine biosynthesis selenosugar synthase SenB [Candidatus Polarisedimenticolaceae bacterium]